jgi:hypothetical protein
VFLCQKCHKVRDCTLHESFDHGDFGLSYGQCEDCGVTTACVDCHARVKTQNPPPPSPPQKKTSTNYNVQ